MAASVDGLKSYQECAKQVLTVSVAVMTLTVTLWQAIHGHGDKGPVSPTCVVEWSWGLFLATDFFAFWVMIATTGSLLSFDRKANGHALTDADKRVADEGNVENVNIPFGAMLFSFLAALICTAFAAA